MLRASIRRFCAPKRKSAFVPHVSPDQLAHISSSEHSYEDQVSVLLDELTRERLLVRSLRDENESLRSNVSLVAQREAELDDLNERMRQEKLLVSSYKSKLDEEEVRRNELKIDFQNFKQLVELEKVKLKQLRALPLMLAGLGGALATFLIMRGDMLLEREQAKYVKFELDQMWGSRVREIQCVLDEVREENEQLLQAKQTAGKPKNDFLSIAGFKIL